MSLLTKFISKKLILRMVAAVLGLLMIIFFVGEFVKGGESGYELAFGGKILSAISGITAAWVFALFGLLAIVGLVIYTIVHLLNQKKIVVLASSIVIGVFFILAGILCFCTIPLVSNAWGGAIGSHLDIGWAAALCGIFGLSAGGCSIVSAII